MISAFKKCLSGAIAFFIASHAHAEYIWGMADLVKMRDYTIDRIQVPVGSGNFAINHRVAVVDPSTSAGVASVAEYQILDDILRRCIATGAVNCSEINWRPSGREWSVFKIGTPDTVAVTRFYIAPLNSHVFVAANEITGTESTLAVLRRFPNVYIDEGEMFAIKAPLAGYVEGKLPLSQACGEESQSGLTAMLRIYNNGILKPEQSPSALAVRFNDGNHLFTTRNDAAFLADLKRVPGWEIAQRDSDSSDRRAGVWCIPAQTRTLVQSTESAGIPGEGLVGSWAQARTHELSEFSFDGLSLSAPVNYSATTHLISPHSNRTISGAIGINSNRKNTFAITRGLGGYMEYTYAPGQSTIKTLFPKAPLQVDEGWSALKIDEETDLVYAVSANLNAIKLHAYDPTTNSYRWQYTLPAAYRNFQIDDSRLHFAGNYLVGYLKNISSARDSFSGALLVIPLTTLGTPNVKIIDLPGQNTLPVDFSYNPKSAIGSFADARAQSLIHLNFNDWSLTTEPLPFQPHAVLVSTSSDELYATEVPRETDMRFAPGPSTLWKRPLAGGSWTELAPLGGPAVAMSIINLYGAPKIMVLNRQGDSGNIAGFQDIDFIDLKTGQETRGLTASVFGSWRFDKAIAALADRK